MSTLPTNIRPIIVRSMLINRFHEDAPLFTEDDILETKLDGWRALPFYDGKKCWMVGKENQRLYFTEVEKFLAAKFGKHRVILDGELMALDKEGRPLRRNMRRKGQRLEFIAFDILFLDGKDLRGKILSERKIILEKFALDRVRTVRPLQGDPSELLQIVFKHNFEGIVIKSQKGTYYDAKWYKIKNANYRPT